MFWTNYRNTVVYTVVATVISIVLTTCYAYVLSKKHLKGRGVLVGIAVFTMFFNGGLIPNYVLITSLGLRNTIWADRAAQRHQRVQPAGDEGVLREPARASWRRPPPSTA